MTHYIIITAIIPHNTRGPMSTCPARKLQLFRMRLRLPFIEFRSVADDVVPPPVDSRVVLCVMVF